MSGHGHVTPNADGSRTRCGGPGICAVCNIEAAADWPRLRAECVTAGEMHARATREIDALRADNERLRALHDEGLAIWEAENDQLRRQREENRNNWIAASKMATELRAEVERLRALLRECRGPVLSCCVTRTGPMGDLLKRIDAALVREGKQINLCSVAECGQPALAPVGRSVCKQHDPGR